MPVALHRRLHHGVPDDLHHRSRWYTKRQEQRPAPASPTPPWLGWPGASLLYMSAAVIGLIGILVTRETYGRAERARVNAIVAEERARVS